MSKYYGESERLLGKVFTLANEIPHGAIIFLDEVAYASDVHLILYTVFLFHYAPFLEINVNFNNLVSCFFLKL